MERKQSHFYAQIDNTVGYAHYSLITRGKLFSSVVGNIRVRPAVMTRAGTNTPSDEYDTYRDTGWRIRYVSRIHFFSEAKLGNG